MVITMKHRGRTILLVILTILIVIQFIPIPKTNPPTTGEIQAPEPVKAVFQRSCYDCHSNQTVWPWYSRVAPVSWLLYRDVTGGRKAMNLSEWQQMPVQRQNRRRKGVWSEVSGGDMPPWFYRPLHPAGKLSDADKATLKAWSDAGPAVPRQKSEGGEQK
jgi:hypothetical protein